MIISGMSISLISELCEYANMMENEKTKFCKTKKSFSGFYIDFTYICEFDYILVKVEITISGNT